MSIEQFSENEKRLKEKSEEERKAEIAREIELKHEKEKLFEVYEKDKKLAFLKTMIERGLIKPSVAEAILLWAELDSEEIEEILSKIDEIEGFEDIDHILPKSLRVAREEYLNALASEDERKLLLGKIDESLGYLYRMAHPHDLSIVDFFSSVFFALNRNLVKVQENTIDIKRSLSK